MTSNQVCKKLKISAFKLKKLRENGEIKATPIDKKHFDYDEQSVKNFYGRLYNRAKTEKIRLSNPNYKRGKPGRRRTIEIIGRIGPNAMTIIAKDLGDLSVPNKNTPDFRKTTIGKGMFTEKKFLEIHEGYDFLRNFGIISCYVEERYGIDVNALQLLLYLYPLNYFSAEDYRLFPHTSSYKAALRTNGKPNDLLEIAVYATNRQNHIFTLKSKYKRIVVEFYKLLAGVKQINKDPKLKLKSSSKYNKIDPISDVANYLAGIVIDA